MPKCNFCNAKAVRVYQMLFGYPKDNYMFWEKRDDKIYACEYHKLHLEICNLDDSELSEKALYQKRLIENFGMIF